MNQPNANADRNIITWSVATGFRWAEGRQGDTALCWLTNAEAKRIAADLGLTWRGIASAVEVNGVALVAS